MIREEMLRELHSLDCRIFWPGEWDDIGYTEHQIWVNSEGYGYFSCDEPGYFYRAKSIPDDKWKLIRTKIKNGTLSNEDIEGTSLADMIFFEDESAFSEEWINDMLSLPEKLDTYYYCADSWEGPRFFSTEKELLSFLNRDWCDVYWNELGDEILALWINRLRGGALEWDIDNIG